MNDLLQQPTTWHAEPGAEPAAQDPPGQAVSALPQRPPLWPLLSLVGAVPVLLVLLALGLSLGRSGAPQAAVQTPVPAIANLPQQTINGVTLIEWPNGPHWLSFYKANRAWLGQPIWPDRMWHGHDRGCSAFTRAIICEDPNPKTKGTEWALTPVLLGEMALRHAGLRPHPSAQPAPIVVAYLARLRAQGADTFYRLGLLRSPVLTQGNLQEQYFQRALLQWPTGSQDPADISLAPLGQLAVANGW